MASLLNLKPNAKQTVDGYDWWVQDSGASYSITEASPGIIRFQVNPGDRWSQDPSDRCRSELASTNLIANGTPINVAYSMNVEPGSVNSASWMVLGQFHQNDYVGAPSLSPPFEINMVGQKMDVTIGYTGQNGQAVYLTLFADANDIVEGHSYAMNVSVTFDPNGNGHLLVQRDGATIVNYSGPLGFATQSSVYWKEGVYEASDATTLMAVDYGNLSLTTQSPSSATNYSGVQSYSQYTGSGALISATTNTYNAAGDLLSSTVIQANGAKSVSTYAIPGQSYVSMTQQFSAAGALVGVTESRADGSLVYQMTAANGGRTEATYDAAGYLLSYRQTASDGSGSINVYGSPTHGLSSYDLFNASGQTTMAEVFNADGSKEIERFLITGQPYTHSTTDYNAAGVVVSLTENNANGSLYYQQFQDADGATEYKTYTSTGVLQNWSVVAATGARNQSVYDAGGLLSTYLSYAANGQLSLYETFATSGQMTLKQVVAADGSKEIQKWGITGQAYSSTTADYSARGVQTALTQYNGDGSLYYQQFVDARGSTEYKSYTSSGVLQNWVISNLDGSRSQTTYNASGQTASQLAYNAMGVLTSYEVFNTDGSCTIRSYAITGQSYVSATAAYGATGKLTSLQEYNANGSLYYACSISGGVQTVNNYSSSGALQQTTVIQVNGSESVKLYAANLVVAAIAGNESFTSFHNDTFSFGPTFGADVINGFNAGSGASHDVIALSKLLAPDFQHLQMAQLGTDTTIYFGSAASITLSAVKPGTLTADNFSFA